MLNYMRQNAGSRFIKILLAAIAASFIIGFGFLPSVNKSGGAAFAAKVGGETISAEELDQAYRAMYRNLSESMGGKVDEKLLKSFNLAQMALDNLVSRRLRLQAAEDMGVHVSDAEVRESIRSLPAFQRGGGFDKEIYLRVLQLNRMTPPQFEAAQREDLAIARAEDLVRAGAQVTPAEAREEFLRQQDKVVLSYVGYAAKEFADKTEAPGDEALKAAYEESKDRYKTKPQVRVEYVEFPLKAYAGAAPAEAVLRERYTADLAKYTNEEQVRARHILVGLKDGEEKAKAKAEAILARVKKGESFEALAKELSEDPGSAAQGGDLGFFPRGRMVGPFEEAAFALEPGEVGGPVKTDFGFHILKLEERKDAGVVPFEQARAEIERAVRDEQEEQAAETAAQAFRAAAVGGAEFKAPAPAARKETGFFSAGDDVPGVGKNYAFTGAAVRLRPGEIGEALRVGDAHVVIKCVEAKEAAIPPFEDVKEKVLEAYRIEKAGALAKAAAEAALARLKGGEATLDRLAQEHGSAVLETGEVGRPGPYVTGLGAAQALKDAAFSAAAGAALPEAYEVKDMWVVAQVKERKTPLEEDVAASLPDFTKKLLEQRRAEIARAWLEGLKASAKVVYNDELIKRFES